MDAPDTFHLDLENDYAASIAEKLIAGQRRQLVSDIGPSDTGAAPADYLAVIPAELVPAFCALMPGHPDEEQRVVRYVLQRELACVPGRTIDVQVSERNEFISGGVLRRIRRFVWALHGVAPRPAWPA